MRKYISILLAAMLCFAFPAVAEETVAIDVEKVDLCRKLGFMTDEYGANDVMPKSEFAAMAARLGGYSARNDEETKKLIDEITFLAELKGTDLSEGITYASAAKIMVSLLGYEQLALNRGADVQSYINQAITLGLCRGISGSYGKRLTVAEAAQMMSNAFDISYMQVSGIEEGVVKYEKGRDDILSVQHKIYKKKGTVTATSATGLYSPESAAGKKRIAIDGAVMNTNLYCLDYIGSRVSYYYRDNGDDLDLLWIKPENPVLELSADVISEIGYTQVKYRDGSKTRTEAIAENAAYIYNGAAYPDMTEAEMKPKSGYVLLTSESGSAPYTTVMVWNFDNVLVNDFDYNKYIMIDSANKKREFEVEDCKEVKVTDENGQPMYMLDIKFGRFCSIAESKKGEVLRVIINQNKIMGTVNAYAADVREVSIDGEIYTLSEDFATGGSDEMARLEVGLSGTFYINSFGKIAGIVWSGDDGMFVGYFIKAASVGGIGNDVEVKIFTSAGTHEILKCADKVSVDSQTAKPPSDSVLTLAEKQLVRYRLNGDKEITEIDTAYTTEPENGESEYTLKCLFNGSGYYKSTQFLFSGRSPITSATVVFNVPNLEDTTMKDDDYTISGGGGVKGEVGYTVMSYSVGDRLVAEYLVNISQEKAADVTAKESDADFAVIKKITNTMNAEGDAVQQVECFHNGVLQTYMTTEQNTIPGNIVAGDCVFLLMKKGAVAAVTPVYTGKTGQWHLAKNPSVPTYYLNEWQTCCGKALRYEDGFVQIEYDATTPPTTTTWGLNTDIFRATSYKITVVDYTISDKPTVTAGTVNDIETFEQVEDKCSRMVVFSSYANPRYMVVYKEA